VAQGFSAAAPENEVRCPEIELNQLVQISDVTPGAGRDQGSSRQGVQRQAQGGEASLEKECSAGDEKLRCDVVELYHGGQYSLYRYKRSRTCAGVRARGRIAFFGGDRTLQLPPLRPGRLLHPRLRGRQAGRTDHYFKFSRRGQGGPAHLRLRHPGGTDAS